MDAERQASEEIGGRRRAHHPGTSALGAPRPSARPGSRPASARAAHSQRLVRSSHYRSLHFPSAPAPISSSAAEHMTREWPVPPRSDRSPRFLEATGRTVTPHSDVRRSGSHRVAALICIDGQHPCTSAGNGPSRHRRYMARLYPSGRRVWTGPHTGAAEAPPPAGAARAVAAVRGVRVGCSASACCGPGIPALVRGPCR